METTFASRVLEFRQHKKLSQAAFAEQCGLAQGNITQMEAGTDPKQSNAVKLLAGFPDLNPDWLLLGAGEMLRGGQELHPLVAGARQVRSRLADDSEMMRELISAQQQQITDLRSQVTDLRGQLGRVWQLVPAAVGKVMSSLGAASQETLLAILGQQAVAEG